jgi:peptidoglycan hydrolase CwlO-like protein
VKIKYYVDKFFLFFKKYSKYIIFGISVLIFFALTYFLKNSYLDKLISSYKFNIKKRELEVANLETEKALLLLDLDQNSAEIEKINEKINSVYEDIQESREKISELELSKKLDKFDELGY